MNIKKILRKHLSLGDDQGDRPDPPSAEGDATPIAEPPLGWVLKNGSRFVEGSSAFDPTERWGLREPGEAAPDAKELYHAAPPILRGEGYTLGVDPRNGQPKKLLGEQRTHAYVLGKTGVGKSSFLLSQMVQDVEHGESVILLDPHGDLAKQFLSHIPRERWRDVIYINPLTAKERGKVIELNFLEFVPEAGREMAKRAFMSAMKKIHPHSWGYRMESIMRYSLNLVYTIMEFPTLSDLLDAIGDRRGKRTNRMLQNPNVDKETKDFWEEDYDDYREDFKVAAQDKIYKLVSESDLKPMTNAKRSSVSFFEAMNEGKTVIVDISEGKLSSDLTSYLGTLILMRVYQAATAREGMPESKREPVHLYIDEAHRFMSEVIQDNMRSLRKFGVFVTGASQNLQEYGEVMENEVQELADTLMAFKCGEQTARNIAASFPTLGQGRNKEAWNAIANLPYYTFYTSTPVGGVTEVRTAETVDLGRGQADWEEVAEASLDEYGEPIKEYERARGKVPIPDVEKLDPINYLVLSILAEEWQKKDSPLPPREDDSVDWRLRKSHLYDKMQERYGFGKTEVYNAGSWLERYNYIKTAAIKKNADGSKAKTKNKFFWIAPKGIEELYPEVRGPRVGSRRHVTMICQLIKHYRENNYYPVPITERTEGVSSDDLEYYPDLLVFPPYRKGGEEYSPRSWATSSVFAVEAEAFPTGSRKEDVEKGEAKGTGSHLDRTVNHFERMEAGLEIPAVFAVRNEHDAEKVEEVLEDAGANIRGGDPARMERGDAKVIHMDDPLPADDTELKNQVKKSTHRVEESSRSEEKRDTGKGRKHEASRKKEEKVRYLKKEKPEPEARWTFGRGGEAEKVKRKRGGSEVGLPEARSEGTERDISWTALVKKYKQRKKSSQPPEKLAEILFELKEKGCKFGVNKKKNATYLQVRKYEDNKQKVRGALPVDESVEEALEMAKIEV